MSRRPLALLAAALVLAGCGGRGFPDAPASPGSARSGSSGALPPPPGSSAPSAPSAPSSVPSSGPTAPPTAAVAGCPAGAVTADRAPFCFALPAGFRDSSSRPDYGYGWQWRALVSAGPHDLIEVVAQPVRTRLTALDDAGRRRFVDQLRLRPDALHVLDAGPLTATTVAGAKAFAQDATYRLDPAPPPSFGPPSGASSSAPTADVSVAVHSLIVLASAAVVYVSCQATAPRAATVATACREVQASLHVS